MYREAQWAWIAERWHEGYGMSELGRFLGIMPTTVYQNLYKRGYRYTPEAERTDADNVLVPLKQRKAEFNALWDKEW